MYFDQKIMFFLWYLLQFDLDVRIEANENPNLAAILVPAYETLITVISDQIDTQEDAPEWVRQRLLRQSGNHINKIFQTAQSSVT
jgi:hypothetical protein